MSLDLDALSGSEIATLAENPDVRINSTKVTRGLAKLPDDIAVKFGWEITDEEVANQKFAYEYSLKSDIKVPKIYRFFRIRDKAYIVMDFMEGVTLDEINCRENPGLMDRLALAMESLFSQYHLALLVLQMVESRGVISFRKMVHSRRSTRSPNSING